RQRLQFLGAIPVHDRDTRVSECVWLASFFFQAEDGIRDGHVTGVQTCALPILSAGVTTVESLADMTPEQLEAIPGIGPKTVEKISIAVNNYFSSLEGGEVSEELDRPPEQSEDGTAGLGEELGSAAGGQAGDTQGVST